MSSNFCCIPIIRKSKRKNEDTSTSTPVRKHIKDEAVIKSNGSSSSSMPKTDANTIGSDNSSDNSSEITRGETETVDGVLDGNPAASLPSEQLKQKNKDIVNRRATMDDDFEGIRIVFLGPCNSGKSTLVKQLQSIFLDGPSPEKLELYRHLVIDNTLQAVKSVLIYMEKQNIMFQEPKHEATKERIMGIYDSNSIHLVDDDNGTMTTQFGEMYRDAGFLRALELGPKYQLIESAKYFLDNFARIFSEEYNPTLEDMLMSRSSTLAVSKEIVPINNGLPIKIQDFGGYRFQRLKWYSYFTATIDAIVYVHSLSSYNLCVEEDPAMNQMEESLKIFEEISNHDVLKRMPLILILNKKDILEEKLKVEHFAKYWPEYKGENSSTAVVEYVKSKFRVLDKSTERKFYAYICNAIDRTQSKVLLKAIVKIAQKSHDEKSIQNAINKQKNNI